MSLESVFIHFVDSVVAEFDTDIIELCERHGEE